MIWFVIWYKDAKNSVMYGKTLCLIRQISRDLLKYWNKWCLLYSHNTTWKLCERKNIGRVAGAGFPVEAMTMLSSSKGTVVRWAVTSKEQHMPGRRQECRVCWASGIEFQFRVLVHSEWLKQRLWGGRWLEWGRPRGRARCLAFSGKQPTEEFWGDIR